MKNTIIQFFHYEHLPEKLKEISIEFYHLAHDMEQLLPPSPEKTAMFRNLLQAKDCALRASIYKEPE